MSRGTDPKLRELARDLQLDSRGDCAQRIRAHAVSKVRDWSTTFRVESVRCLLELVAGMVSLKIIYIEEGADVQAIARAHGVGWPELEARLRAEFIRGSTMGCVLAHPKPEACGCRYYAFVDARGDRAIRAYFTAWHEVAHMLVQPPQLSFVFRRTPAPGVSKDRVECLIDEIAGDLAFFQPFAQPELERQVGERGRLDLAGIQSIRQVVAPELSFQATAFAVVRLATEPVAFLTADLHLKPSEARGEQTDQLSLIARTEPVPQLRISAVLPNQAFKNQGFGLFRHMRVPEGSVMPSRAGSGAGRHRTRTSPTGRAAASRWILCRCE